MKKNTIYLLLMMPLLALLGSCDSKDEIVFDHELPQFELKQDAILLEVIMPQGTKPDENIYIAGAFNGGEEAVGQTEWQLEKAANSDVKWGIYLSPATFKNGKTLADGFYFVSDKQGIERTVKNEDASHVLNVGIGTRTNVMVSRWASYFDEEPGEEDHDGYVIYVEDNSSWEGLALYGWGDAEFAGGWPGIQATGTKTIGKVTYKYFDTGEANKGLNVNLIFNNNNGGKQFDGPNITLDRDFYFSITDTGCEEVVPSTYTGFTVYVEDNTGWDEIALYGWGDAEFAGAWPGMQVTGTKTIKGVSYKFFDLGDEATGLNINFIFNNNNHGKQFDGPNVTVDRDFYFRLSESGVEEVDPDTPEQE